MCASATKPRFVRTAGDCARPSPPLAVHWGCRTDVFTPFRAHRLRPHAREPHHGRDPRHADRPLLRRDRRDGRLLRGLSSAEHAAPSLCRRRLSAGLRSDALGRARAKRSRAYAELFGARLHDPRRRRLRGERARRPRRALARPRDRGRHALRPRSLRSRRGAYAMDVPLHRVHESRGARRVDPQHDETLRDPRGDADFAELEFHRRDDFAHPVL